MLEEENKKETQESEQVPAAERIQEPEAVQSQESEPAQDQTPNPVRESAGHSRRRQGEDKSQNLRFGVIAAGVVIVLAVAAFAGKSLLSRQAGAGTAKNGAATASELSKDEASEESRAEEIKEKEAVVASYKNLGIVQVSGYLNMRETASTDGNIIGKLMGGSACEILDDSQEGWYQVSSGGLEGYISSEFVQTGEAAKTEAFELVKKMAVITTDKLNIRSEPSEDAQVLEQALKNERYSIVSEQDGWIQISEGYISADYVDVRYALNEARKLDLRTMVLNMYDNLGISNVNNYLNIRVEPKEDAKIIGKMTSKSGGEILETTEDGGWYKIKSGPVTGYVKSEFILTGEAAKQEALQVAQLMAIVSTDRLNARTEPNTDAPIWTQISNSERYSVMSQQDGWVQIALDETSAYVATEFVDVRYALNEAIEFTPVEETPEPETKAASSKGGSGSKSSSNGGSGSQKASSSGSSKRAQIANYATQFLGNPYVYGGTSLTNGADCSGFTMSVFAHFGISTGRSSRDQAAKGKEVAVSAVQPGDLLFYASGNYINHVALYIGNGQVIHASTAKSGIKISPSNYRTPCKAVSFLN
mgnify:CR=1 FL=1